MDRYPRADYRPLGRYLPDRSAVAVDLSDNRNLWGAHPAALEVLAAAASGAPGAARPAEYPWPYGEPLAEAVAARLGVSPAHVTTGAGGTGVLDAVMRSVAPTSMRFLDPGWPAAAMLAQMNGHRPAAVDWDAGLDDPEAFAGDEQVIVYVANPANPTGRAVPDDWLRAVQARAEAAGSVFILDEAYGEYHRDAADRAPFDLALAGERTVCVKTLSKAYGLAGLRAGYGVGSASLVLEADKARGPFVLAGVSCAAAAAAVSSDSPWLARTVAETRRNRDRVLARLARSGHAASDSAANFVFVLLPSAELAPATAKLERSGVRVRPFDSARPGGSGLRATVGPWETMELLAAGLDQARM